MNLDLGLEVFGVDFIEPPEEGIAGARDEDLDIAEFLARPAHEFADRVCVGDVKRQSHGLTATRADLAGQLFAFVHTSGAEGNRESARGKLGSGGGADPRGRPGDDDGPAAGVRFEACHQRSFTVIGRLANPRTLLECTRTAPASSTS